MIKMKEYAKTAKEMLEFIEESPTCFQAVAGLKKLLKKEGFSELKETEDWKSLEKGGKYYVVRNSSSIIAFHIPTQESVRENTVVFTWQRPTAILLHLR